MHDNTSLPPLTPCGSTCCSASFGAVSACLICELPRAARSLREGFLGCGSLPGPALDLLVPVSKRALEGGHLASQRLDCSLRRSTHAPVNRIII